MVSVMADDDSRRAHFMSNADASHGISHRLAAEVDVDGVTGMRSPRPTVSLVIPVRNEARNIAWVLEQIAGCRTAIFDKTGTLTKGKPEVTDIVSLSDMDDEDILSIDLFRLTS